MTAASRWRGLALTTSPAPVALIVYTHVYCAAVCADGGTARACGPCCCHGQAAVARLLQLLVLPVMALAGCMFRRLLKVRRLLLLLCLVLLLLLCIYLHGITLLHGVLSLDRWLTHTMLVDAS